MCAAYPAIAANGEEQGFPLHKLLTGRLKSLRSDPGLEEVLACLATMDIPAGGIRGATGPVAVPDP
jgi:hypothetical protein